MMSKGCGHVREVCNLVGYLKCPVVQVFPATRFHSVQSSLAGTHMLYFVVNVVLIPEVDTMQTFLIR